MDNGDEGGCGWMGVKESVVWMMDGDEGGCKGQGRGLYIVLTAAVTPSAVHAAEGE